MSSGYKVFLILMTLVLLLGIAVLIYGLTYPSALPRLTPRAVYAFGYMNHG